MAKKKGTPQKLKDKMEAQKKYFDYLDTRRIVQIAKLQQRIVDLEAELAKYKKVYDQYIESAIFQVGSSKGHVNL